jgi:ribonucleoside-diphosphate reductase alpha chain
MSVLVSPTPTTEPIEQSDLSGPPPANRHRLLDERAAITHHFSIAGHEGYLTVGLYPTASRARSLSAWPRLDRASRG